MNYECINFYYCGESYLKLKTGTKLTCRKDEITSEGTLVVKINGAQYKVGVEDLAHSYEEAKLRIMALQIKAINELKNNIDNKLERLIMNTY